MGPTTRFTEPPLPPLPPGPARRRVWVALSGGLDSSVLLQVLHRAGIPGLRAIHVHHGLQAAADDWARSVRRSCRRLAVPLTVRRVRVAADDPAGPEAAARSARYAVFTTLLRPGDLLVTAHHREDQAETVLLRALRGTGIAGLAAMSACSPLGRGQVWRPWLELPRARLLAWAGAQGIEGVDDPHNRDPRYARSWLRTAVWPALASHWPQAADSLVRLARHAADAEQLLTELAREDLQRLAGPGGSLSVAALLALSPARRRNVLRQAWRERGWQAPAADLLDRLEREVLEAGADRQPCLHFAGGEARRYRDRLYLMAPLPTVPADWSASWVRGRQQALPAGGGRLWAATAPPARLDLRFARGGERLRPAGSAHQRTLKQLAQEAGLPVWIRERMPLIYEGGVLRSVAGLWQDAAFAERGWQPRWECGLPGGPAPESRRPR